MSDKLKPLSVEDMAAIITFELDHGGNSVAAASAISQRLTAPHVADYPQWARYPALTAARSRLAEAERLLREARKWIDRVHVEQREEIDAFLAENKDA